jgi:adenosylcobinamide-GDP ribazoletransferase
MRVAEPVRLELRGGAAAIAFLTRVPIGPVVELGGADLARGAVAFPLVGAVIGAAVAATGIALSHAYTPGVAGAVALAAAIAMTGALHLDGLADTADSLGARTRAHALTIMRDPQVGAFGVAAIVAVLLVEASALGALIADERGHAIVAAFTASRAVAPAVAAWLPYARAEPGLARPLTGNGRSRAVLAVLLASGVVIALSPRHYAWVLAGAAVCALAVATLARRRFGGVTGDVLGAAVAVTEAVCLTIACAQ